MLDGIRLSFQGLSFHKARHTDLAEGIFQLLASPSVEAELGGSAALAGLMEQLCLPRTRGCNSHWASRIDTKSEDKNIKRECYFYMKTKVFREKRKSLVLSHSLAFLVYFFYVVVFLFYVLLCEYDFYSTRNKALLNYSDTNVWSQSHHSE